MCPAILSTSNLIYIYEYVLFNIVTVNVSLPKHINNESNLSLKYIICNI